MFYIVRACPFLLILSGFSSQQAIRSSPRDSSQRGRDKRFLGVFTVVRFPNTACNISSDNTAGVCYTPLECSALGGQARNSCASGFGVCCAFTAGCGRTTSLNNTYFSSSEGISSPCSLKVCRADANICQIRLDFDTFNIDGPVTATTTPTSFTATSYKSTNNVICGNNLGQHMILEASPSCNSLVFQWSTGTPSFNIQVSQIECDVRWKPSAGCTQWFTGTTGTVQSYNWAGGHHLAGQDYTVCIREEAGYCSITYTADTFKISLGLDANPALSSTFSATGTENCNLDTMSDYILIPGGGPTVAPPVSNEVPNEVYFCGAFLAPAIVGTPAVGAAAGAAVSTSHKPFTIHFHTDYTEVTATAEDGATDVGFSISYTQVAC